jgi:hypothetical protein
MNFIYTRLSSIVTIAVSCLTCTAFVLFALPAPKCFSQEAAGQTVATKYYSLQEIQTIADGIIEWKKSSLGLSAGASILDDSNELLAAAGEFNADWIALGTSRLHPEQEFPKYLEALRNRVSDFYINKLTKGVKYTDFHRRSLVMLSLDDNPRNVKYVVGGNEFTADVISDFAFNMGYKIALGDQGIASRIWALISIDSMQYPMPVGSKNTRDTLITELLSRQLSNGGFSILGPQANPKNDPDADPDITAMVIQALATYYNSTKTYTYKNAGTGLSISKTVRNVIDESLLLLSTSQHLTGDFASGGLPRILPERNPQTTAQVALALACLGIDPQKDSRFIKGGKSLIDGIMLYRNTDKGFKSTLDTKTSGVRLSDDMPSGQVLYTLAAIIRNMKNMRRLYDFRPEQTATLKTNIAKITAEIAASSEQTPRQKLLAMSNSYKLIVDDEKMYVHNYMKLYDLFNKPAGSTSITISNKNDSTIYSGSINSSGFESDNSDSSASENSATVIDSGANFGNTGSGTGISQNGKDDESNSRDSSENNKRILIIVIIFVLIISGATLNFYMIRKARIKR